MPPEDPIDILDRLRILFIIIIEIVISSAQNIAIVLFTGLILILLLFGILFKLFLQF